MKTTTIRASDYALAGSRYSLRTVVRKTLRNTSGQVLIDLDVHGIPGEDPINVRIRHTDEDEEICVAAGLERVQNRYPVVLERLFFLPGV